MDNTTTITFRSQSRSVRVKAPASGYRANPEINQKVSVSGGGTIYTTDFGGETQKLQVQLRRLTRTEYAALKEFILTTCRGSAFSFDLTDYQGTHQNLHYISGLEGAELHRGDLFNVTLQLQKSTDQSIRLGQNLITNPNLTLNPDGRTAEGWTLPGTNPVPAMRNVDISERFGTRAFEAADTDRYTEIFLTSEKFPVLDCQTKISCRMNRTAGDRLCRAVASFYNSDDELVAVLPPGTGWVSIQGSYAVFGQIIGRERLNNEWNLFQATFGPGSNTFIPPSAASFSFGAMIIPVSSTESFATTLRLADFSMIVTP